MVNNNEWRTRSLGVLFLLGLYFFVCCAVDVFHSDDCRDPISKSSNDGCPACLLKNGNNAVEPGYTAMILPTDLVWLASWPCPLRPRVGEPARVLFLRGPPPNISC